MTHEAVAFLDDADTRLAVTAERIALGALGGGCQVPIGIYCSRDGDSFRIIGTVAATDGSRLVRAKLRGDNAEELGKVIAAELLQQGAQQILSVVEMGR